MTSNTADKSENNNQDLLQLLGDKEKINELVQKAWIFINDR